MRREIGENSMGLDLRLDLKMQQQLVMTPQLQQAIKLLQLSRTDLIEAVRDELMENPMLEENSEISASEARVESAVDVQKREQKEQTADVKVEENLTEQRTDIDWEAYFENYSRQRPVLARNDYETMTYRAEATLTRTESLFDHLMWQLRKYQTLPSKKNA